MLQISMLQTKIEDNSLAINYTNQKNLTTVQLQNLQNKKSQYLEQVESYFKIFFEAYTKWKNLEIQNPVNYLSNGKVIKAYNKDGILVGIYDSNENYIVIEYEDYLSYGTKKRRISRLYDNLEKSVVFTYNSKGRLSYITDIYGNVTRYIYDGSVLSAVNFDTGENISLVYLNKNIIEVIEEKNKLKTTISYLNNKPNLISNYINAVKINNGEITEGQTYVETITLTFEYSLYGDMITNMRNGKVAERYYFNAVGYLTEYRVEEDKVVTKAEKYLYVPYWIGSGEQPDPRKVTTKADKTCLYTTTLDNFVFVDGESKEDWLNQFNMPYKTVTSSVKVNASDTNEKSVEIDYVYDDEQRLIKKKMSTRYTNPEKTIISIVKYNYNKFGEIAKTESYVEGEELSTGKTIEETIFDEKGNVVKSYSYNTLDPTSKFYTESEYDEKGNLTTLDESGENKVRYKTANNLVTEEILPNGSKFGYGYDLNGNKTAISHSDENGEANSTTTNYTSGMLTQLNSGNVNVEYSVDFTPNNEYKNRVESIKYNGVENYITKEYSEVVESDNGLTRKFATTTNKKNESVTTKRTIRDKLLSKTYNNGKSVVYTYDAKDKLTNVVDTINSTTSRSFVYTYDNKDNVAYYSETEGGISVFSESFTYNNFNELTVLNQSINLTYNFDYANNANRELKKITVKELNLNHETVELLAIKPQLDCLNRNIGRQIYVGTNKIAEEKITYRKVGDHATSMPSSIYFGNTKSARFCLNDNIKYAYDSMGNISKIYENGELVITYEYDKLNRLVRENNLNFGKTWFYKYDNNGNVLGKTEANYTLGDVIYITPLAECNYDGDMLMVCNGSAFTYDVIGNPTTYMGKSATWEMGRRLTSFNGHTFTYDAQGRRLTKDNISFTYDSKGRLVRQSNGLDFFYDHTGIAGFRYESKVYAYRKNTQGDIIDSVKCWWTRD